MFNHDRENIAELRYYADIVSDVTTDPCEKKIKTKEGEKLLWSTDGMVEWIGGVAGRLDWLIKLAESQANEIDRLTEEVQSAHELGDEFVKLISHLDG